MARAFLALPKRSSCAVDISGNASTLFDLALHLLRDGAHEARKPVLNMPHIVLVFKVLPKLKLVLEKRPLRLLAVLNLVKVCADGEMYPSREMLPKRVAPAHFYTPTLLSLIRPS